MTDGVKIRSHILRPYRAQQAGCAPDTAVAGTGAIGGSGSRAMPVLPLIERWCQRMRTAACSPISVGGLPVTAAVAILNNCTTLLSSTSQ